MQLPKKWYGGWWPWHPHTYSRSTCAPNMVQDSHPFMHDSPDLAVLLFPPQQKLTFKTPPNMQTHSTWSTTHHASSGASGSGYHASKNSMDMGEPPLWETPQVFFFLILFLLMMAYHRTLISQQELSEKHFGGITPYGMDTMACGDMLNGDLAAGGITLNVGKIGNLGSFPQICYHFETDEVFCSPCEYHPLLTKMLLSMKWVVWMIVCFTSSASPPWLMEFPLDIYALKEMTLLPLLYPEAFHADLRLCTKVDLNSRQ